MWPPCEGVALVIEGVCCLAGRLPQIVERLALVIVAAH